MGLDMYMYVHTFEVRGNWENKDDEVKNFYPEKLKVLQDDIYKRNFLSKLTEYQVAYWRKANAIHGWIIENCADGEDDHQDIWMGKERLTKLLNVVKAVLDDNSLADKLLPVEKGFFFGSQEYDDWYFEDLKYANYIIPLLLDYLEKNPYDEIYYRASW